MSPLRVSCLSSEKSIGRGSPGTFHAAYWEGSISGARRPKPDSAEQGGRLRPAWALPALINGCAVKRRPQ